MHIKESYNFKEVDSLISCSGTFKSLNWRSLADEGYDLVINLLPERHKYAAFNEKKAIGELGIKYIFIPVDWENPLNSDYDSFESAMKLNKDKKIHIHCAANYRATGFYAIYAYKNLAWSSNKLYEFIASIWQLSDYPIWDKFISTYVKEN